MDHRLSVTEFDGRVVNYTYDDLYRLTEENINNGDRTITYTYDNAGNRLTRDDSAEGLTTYTYDDNDRLLTEVLTREDGTTVHTITHSYDDNGNLISRDQETDRAVTNCVRLGGLLRPELSGIQKPNNMA